MINRNMTAEEAWAEYRKSGEAVETFEEFKKRWEAVKSPYDTGVTPNPNDTPLQAAHRSGGVLWGKNET